MRRSWFAAPFLYLLLIAALAAAEQQSSPLPAAGEPLPAALRALQGPQLQFLFSDELVPTELRVLEVPPPGPALEVAAAILAPHGLGLRLVQPGLYAVVGDATSRRAAAADSGTVTLETTLAEVVIAASRYRLGPLDDAASLDALEMTANPGVGDDPLRAIARLPGIASDGISARPYVRGGDADEVLMLFDGFPLRRPYHLASYQNLFSVVDANLVRHADVYSGGFPARYGNRMAGVFDFQSRRAGEEPAHALGVDFYNAAALSSGDADWAGGRYVAAGRIGTLSPLLHVFAPSAGDPRYADIYLRFEREVGEQIAVSGNLLWARDELQIADEVSGEAADLEDLTRYLWLRADMRVSPELTLSGLVGQSLVESRREGTVLNPDISVGEVRDRRDSSLWDLRGNLAWQPSPVHLLEAGAELTIEDGRYDYAARAVFTPAVAELFMRPAMLGRELQFQPSRTRAAAFLSHRWQPGGRFSAEWGLRAQTKASQGDDPHWLFDPRVALGLELGTATRAHLSWGQFHQQDEVHELKVEDGLAAFPEAQRSDHLILGLQHDFAGGMSLRGELFTKRQTAPRARFENLFSRRTILPEISADRVEVLPEFAELRGIELSGSWRRQDWEGWVTLGWSEALDEVGGEHTPRSWDTGLGAAGGALWRHGPWLAQASLNIHRGLPITALVDSASGAELGPRNAERLPVFSQLDLLLQYRQPLRRGDLRYSLEIINVTDSSNQCCSQLVTSPEGGFSLSPQRGLPFFPSLGLRWSW